MPQKPGSGSARAGSNYPGVGRAENSVGPGRTRAESAQTSTFFFFHYSKMPEVNETIPSFPTQIFSGYETPVS
jgi:hypothetical protein